jgi:hypothetical protein
LSGAGSGTESNPGWASVAAAALLGLAAVATGWAAYQATRWGGVQVTTATEATLASNEAGQQYQLADSKFNLDQLVFVEWATAANLGDEAQAGWIETSLFSEELTVAFATWDPETELSPFESDEYVLVELDEADDLVTESAELLGGSNDANQNGDEYVLTASLLAVVLFFGGISHSLRGRRLREAMVIAGGVIFAVALGVLVMLPVQ